MTARRATAVGLLLLATLGTAGAWEDATGDRDMPWLGRGGRARWFHDRSSCLMCPTGYRDEERWGGSRWFGEDPYVTVANAMRFLDRRGVLPTWPKAHGEGDVADGGGVIGPRAAPYRMTVVMIQPTVIVMAFDLGALVLREEPGAPQRLGTPYLGQLVAYGTRVPATGSLVWFSPDADQAPTPVASSAPDRGEIVTGGIRLTLVRRGDAWVVERP